MRSARCVVTLPTATAAAAQASSSSSAAAMVAPRQPARAFHAAATLRSRPLPSAYAKYVPQRLRPREGLEKVAAQYAASSAPYNKDIFGSAANEPAANPRANTQLTAALLLEQLNLARKGKNSGNILLSPVALARARVQSAGGAGAKAFSQLNLAPAALKAALETDYSALLSQWESSGDLSLSVGAKEGPKASESFSRAVQNANAQEEALSTSQMAHMVQLPWPLDSATTASGSSSTSAAAATTQTPAVSSSLAFRGYLAPRFTSPDTPFPNYFFNYLGEKSIAHMMVKTAKIWYVESEKFQMIDLPYLNPSFVMSIVLPRLGGERTIQDHPQEFEYDKAPRTAATVDEVLKLFASPMKNGGDVFSHYAKHMSLMPGLVGLPGFSADCTVNSAGASSGEGVGQRSVLTVSPHGLDVGTKTPRQKRHIHANFSLLADHPFVFFIRSVDPTNPQVVLAGVVNEVFTRKDFQTRFPLPKEWREYKEQMGEKVKEMYKSVV